MYVRFACILLPLCLITQEPKTAAPAPYMFIGTEYKGFFGTKQKSVQTIQDETNQAAARGYRVLLLWGDKDNPQVLTTRKQTADPPPQYLLLDSKEEVLNRAGSQGYRFVRRGLTMDFLAVMEKPAGPVTPFEYRILKTRRTSTMENEIHQASVEGWNVAAFIVESFYRWALLERPVGTAASSRPPQGPGPRYKLLVAERRNTLQKELNQAAEAGYELRIAAMRCGNCERGCVLEKPQSPLRASYLVIHGEERLAEEKIKEAMTDGFRPVPGSVIPSKDYFGTPTVEIIMEKRAVSEPAEHRELLLTRKAPEAEWTQKLTKALEDGWEIADWDFGVFVLSKPSAVRGSVREP